MLAKTMILLSASMIVPATAFAATVTIIGTSPEARACYEAAEDAEYVVPGPEALATCNLAMMSENLSYDDRIATLVNRGIVEFRLSQLDRAIADFNAALALEPNQPDALINKGITLLAGGGSIDEALQLLDAGLAGSPQRPWVGHYGRAVAHELAGRDAQAYREYKKAQELKPGWSLARQALARFSVG